MKTEQNQNLTPNPGPWRFCVAPMLDWTDRHCRYVHRLLTRRARLYTEMVTTGALLHGDVPRHLAFDAAEHPLALQLGGSEPHDLARCAKLAEQWGYDEVNLNCGCPSERVQRGAFGACLMHEPALVAQCVQAMRDACSLPITVKHRISVDVPVGQEDDERDYARLRDFVGTLHEAGCTVFIVHARTAILKGLSPKQNREIPPLRPNLAARLRRDFPACTIVLNGGLAEAPAMDAALTEFDGIMVGRAAYHDPWLLHQVDQRWFGEPNPIAEPAELIEQLMPYLERQAAAGVRVHSVLRHCHGLVNGLPGARRFRQTLSQACQPGAGPELLRQAWAQVGR